MWQTFKYNFTIYQRVAKRKKKVVNVIPNIAILFLLGIILTVFVLKYDSSSPTGYVILSLKKEYSGNETITGILSIPFSGQDFVPNTTLIVIKVNYTTKEIPLASIATAQGLVFGTGKYYYRGPLGGSGLGYGIKGNKTLYPNVTVSLNITTYTNTTNSWLITRIANKVFTDPYQLSEKNVTVSIIPGSVSAKGNVLPDTSVAVIIMNNIIHTLTTLTEYEEGFGEGYINNVENMTLNVSLDNLQIPIQESTQIIAKLEDHGDTFAQESDHLFVVMAISDNDKDGYSAENDCNDNDPIINPGQIEIANDKKDNDCNQATPDISDTDNDGYTSLVDCNDTNLTIHPGATEVCGNNLDDNCDLKIDENCHSCPDNDKDGYGETTDSLCQYPGIDCNDNDASIHPLVTEIMGDGIDNDCDPTTQDIEIQFSLVEYSPRNIGQYEQVMLGISVMEEAFLPDMLQNVILDIQMDEEKEVYTLPQMVLSENNISLQTSFNKSGLYVLKWRVTYKGTENETTALITVDPASKITGFFIVSNPIKWGIGLFFITLLGIGAGILIVIAFGKAQKTLENRLETTKMEQGKTEPKKEREEKNNEEKEEKREKKEDYIDLSQLQNRIKEKEIMEDTRR